MMIEKHNLEGVLHWLSKHRIHRENPRQHHGLDISKMTEEEEIRLILPRFIQKPKDLIGIWLWVLNENPIWKTEIQYELAERCRRNQYKGEWMILHRSLKLTHLDLAVYRLLEIRFSSRDLIGNILPRSKKFFKLLEYKVVKKRRSIKPQYHRGYRDHGGRRLAHEVHDCSTTTGENPTKLDFSSSMKKKYSLINFLYG